MILNFIVLGLVPGTDLQLNFMWTLLIGLVFIMIAGLIFSYSSLTRHLKNFKKQEAVLLANS